MKNTKLLGVALVLSSFLSISKTAQAAGGNGTITNIQVNSALNNVIVTFTGVTGGRPSCHNAGSFYASSFSFDITEATGKAMLSLLEGAQLAGKVVGFGGIGVCFYLDPPANTIGVEALGIATINTN